MCMPACVCVFVLTTNLNLNLVTNTSTKIQYMRTLKQNEKFRKHVSFCKHDGKTRGKGATQAACKYT